jgi:hypothetical protein
MEIQMRFVKNLLLLALAVGLFSTGSAMAAQDGSRFDEELNERDFDALRDYLKRKRTVDIDDNEVSNLTISGDVRTEYRHLNESCRGDRLRGHDRVDVRGRPISRNDFDIEFNLRFDYICERSWAVAHVRYDNSAGVDDNGHPCIFPEVDTKSKESCLNRARRCLGDPEGFHGSGNCGDLCLKKAYMGYTLCKTDDSRWDVELGRRGQLYNVFDSNVQFLSRLDGIYTRYSSTIKTDTNWYIQFAGFVVDERVNHFAWATEIGFLNIVDSGFDLKYSLIDWEKHGRNRCFAEDPKGFRFLNSQWTAVYHVNKDVLGRPAKLYAAFLCNHDARNLIINHHNHGKQNLAWYAGILVGEVKKEGDWAIELQYQVVQAQAVPDGDMGGIGRGNVLDESFTTCSHRGNTNFQGWKLEGLYAFTDNITLDSIIEWTTAFDNKVGGTHTYSKFEMEAIYAF